MERIEKTQTNSFTDEEQALAEHYKVEPKLCRLISEIVSGLQGKKEVGTGAVPAEHPVEDVGPTTDIDTLDKNPKGVHENIAEEPQPKKEATPVTVLQSWLSKRNYSEKLTTILLWQLINKEHIYKTEGYCKSDIGNDYYKQFEQEIVNASQDEEYLEKAEPEEIAITGLATGLLSLSV
jgi:hypothetical protein